MNSIPVAGNIFSRILQASWQAAVLALVVLLVQRIFRHKLSPAWRYGLWLLVMVRLLMPASPQSAISIFNLAKFTPRQPVALPSAPPETPIVNLQTPPPNDPSFKPSTFSPENSTTAASPTTTIQPHRPADWFAIAQTIWLLGLGLLALRLIWANLRFASRLARHAPVRDPAILQLMDDCASILHIRRPVIVIETEEVESPAVCGLWKKRLLVPDGVFERFSSEELRHIFLHEMAHIHRRDIEVNWLASVLQILHWFNPVLWLAFARMRADRELAADALALSRVASTENVPYGETILKVVENLARRSVAPGLVGIAESKAGLQERLRAISRCGAARPWRWAALGIAALVAGIGLTSALEPNSATAWTHEAWNMAFNISIKYSNPAVRWSWVKSGINVDMEGLRSNPGKTEIYKELSWIFRFKMGQNLDNAHMFYKLSWAEEMEEALDVQHGHPNFPALINPQTTNEVARAKTLRETYQMDPAIMQEVDTNFGPLDWRLPGAHALYWAEMGKRNGNESKDKDILRRFNGQALAQVCFYQGALPPWVTKVTPQNFLLWPDLDMVTNVIAAYERANLTDDAQKQTSRTAEKNFLRDAVVYLYEYDRDRESAYWFNYMKQNFTNALIGVEINMNYDDYALNHVESSINDLDQTKGTATVLALLSREYIQIIEGDDHAAEESSIKAHAVYNNYESRLPKGSQANIDRIKLAPFDKLAHAEYGFFTNNLPPEAAARLRARLGIDVPTPAPRPIY